MYKNALLQELFQYICV